MRSRNIPIMDVLQKSWLRKVYPLHWLKQRAESAVDQCRYFWLARHHRIAYYPESKLSKLYRDICAIDLLKCIQAEHSWVPNSLFSGGGAADHKFMYVLARALAEFRFRSILECGAGETTVLLDAFARHSGHLVTTLEHDEGWARRIRARTRADTHSVLHCPLVARDEPRVGSYLWYDLSRETSKLPDRFDLFIVDGPPGTSRFSRFGIIRFLLERASDDWLLLWDDVERIGDFESFVALVSKLRSAQVDFGHRLLVSQKTLGILFTPRFESVSQYF